jgi:hypothetical protein
MPQLEFPEGIGRVFTNLNANLQNARISLNQKTLHQILAMARAARKARVSVE